MRYRKCAFTLAIAMVAVAFLVRPVFTQQDILAQSGIVYVPALFL